MIGKGKLYVLVNKDLGMSVGKTAAQVAHAISRVDLGAPHTVIVLEAGTEQLHNLKQYLGAANIPHHLYIDEGINEVPPMSATALAFGMVVDNFTPDFIAGFKLYKERTLWQKLMRH